MKLGPLTVNVWKEGNAIMGTVCVPRRMYKAIEVRWGILDLHKWMQDAPPPEDAAMYVPEEWK